MARVRVAPGGAVDSHADACISLATRLLYAPFDWQCDILEDWLGISRSGKFVARTCGLAVPRQNGKNAIIEFYELYMSAFMGHKVLHTAHEVKTARQAFKRIVEFFERDDLKPLVKNIRHVNGQEAIFLTNGGGIEFIARSKSSGRGYTVDCLICDEAQELTDDELAALLPTIAASPSGNPQFIVLGTPPRPGEGAVFRRIRREGASSAPGYAWTDYGIAEGDEPDLNDRKVIEAANPSLPQLLSWDEVDRERTSMAPETFYRERLGRWDDPSHTFSVFPSWPRLVGVAGDAVTAIGVAVSLDRTVASIGAVRGRGFVSAVAREPFGPWVVEESARIAGERGVPVAVDERGPAASLIKQLEDKGVWVMRVGTQDYASACERFFDMASVGTLRHGDYPELNEAVAAAGWRQVGDRRLWARKNGDISMLEAVTLALYAADVGVTAGAW